MGKILKHLLAIPPKETRCTQRGFDVENHEVKAKIEKIGETFAFGYHAALLNNEPSVLMQNLREVDLEFQGYAFEGAAMALALLDYLTPWTSNRLDSFLRRQGGPYTYMVHIGAGWAMTRIPWGIKQLSKMDPLLRWLAIDGYGFHEGYFHWPKSIAKKQIPKRIFGYARHSFDQGLGRSLWFVKGGNSKKIADTISEFESERVADLWSGIGLAAAYAGGVDRSVLESLFNLSSKYQAQLAQGAAFAAKARERAGNPTAHTELACNIFWGESALDAALITEETLDNLPEDGEIPAYQVWRQRIHDSFRQRKLR